MAVREGEIASREAMSSRSPMPEQEQPTQEHPWEGQVEDHDVVLSTGFRYIDPDGTHVIRSDEFDLMGLGPSLQEAVDDFEQNLYEYVFHLAMLVEEQQATDRELGVANLLTQRLMQVVINHHRERTAEQPFWKLLLASRRQPERRTREWAEKPGSGVPKNLSTASLA